MSRRRYYNEHQRLDQVLIVEINWTKALGNERPFRAKAQDYWLKWDFYNSVIIST